MLLILSNTLKAIKLFFSYFNLKNKVEKTLFIFFSLVLVLIQLWFNTKLIRPQLLGYNSYLLPWIYNPTHANATIKHPLILLLSTPLIAIVNVLKAIMGIKILLLSIYVFYSLVVAFSLIMIFRILHELIQINIFRSILLTVLFSSFAHIIIQAFIIESYPLSLLLLTTTLYILGREIYLKEESNAYLYMFLFILTAGVTITNGAKTVIAFLSTNYKFNYKIKWIIAMGVSFLFLITPVYLITKYILPQSQQLAVIAKKDLPPVSDSLKANNTASNQVEKKPAFFSFIKSDVNVVTSVERNILAESTLFHTSNFNLETGLGRDIYLNYTNPIYNWIIVVFYLLFGFSFCISIKHNFVKVMLAFLIVDVFLHIICRFGIDEPYIYASHWMFIIPIMFAYLYKFKSLYKLYHFFDAAFIVCTIFFLFCNWSTLFIFFNSPLVDVYYLDTF